MVITCLQVSYASVSPLLSDKMTYPYFFRTAAPDTVVNPARIAIMKLFGWTKAAAIVHSRTVFDAVSILTFKVHVGLCYPSKNLTTISVDVYIDNTF